jgi:leucyl/phenylalanyl-tRNA--protein transferase
VPIPVIPLLGSALEFPPAEDAPPQGLVALGGDLSVERLLLAYRSGIFPWSADPITWWSPDPRAIFDCDEIHVSRSLRRTLRRAPFTITLDRCFGGVIRACASVPREDGSTWINPAIIEAYERLHAAGWAHSLECWQGNQLAGGIYGVAIGSLFAGESMFHHVSDASKVAVVHLMKHLRARGYTLFDTQMLTETTRSLGAFEIPRSEYLRRLALAIDQPTTFSSMPTGAPPHAGPVTPLDPT